MKILYAVGARPNFMKTAPIMHAMAKQPNKFEQILVHTGQHHDVNMSGVFLDELNLPQPDKELGVGSGSHAWQTAQIMLRFEPILCELQPDYVFVSGDVNSTLACALVSKKLGFKVAHVEAGLRSFDPTMPEETNRVLTDQISELLFTPSRDGDDNLLREGISSDKIYFVGNVMIDTMIRLLPKAQACWPDLRNRWSLGAFVLVTLHRPSNVDDLGTLGELMSALDEIAESVPVIFPVHPRTQERLRQLRFSLTNPHLHLTDPLGYLQFLALEAHASVVLTDSGGVQEETTFLGTPCLTVRPNTERPVTISLGTNRLIASDKRVVVRAVHEALADRNEWNGVRPELWDGMAAQRIVRAFCKANELSYGREAFGGQQ